MEVAVHLRWCDYIADGTLGYVRSFQNGHSVAGYALHMFTLGYYALPDLPSNTRVRWLKPHEKELALRRMKALGRDLEEPITIQGTVRVLKKWHFWVYTAYYTYVDA